MTQSRQESYEWFDDSDALVAPRVSARALPAPQDLLQPASWWLGGLMFSSLWMFETWNRSASGQPAVGDIAEGLWTLLLSISICYGIYRFARAQPRPFAPVLCILSAIILLMNHATAV